MARVVAQRSCGRRLRLALQHNDIHTRQRPRRLEQCTCFHLRWPSCVLESVCSRGRPIRWLSGTVTCRPTKPSQWPLKYKMGIRPDSSRDPRSPPQAVLRFEVCSQVVLSNMSAPAMRSRVPQSNLLDVTLTQDRHVAERLITPSFTSAHHLAVPTTSGGGGVRVGTPKLRSHVSISNLSPDTRTQDATFSTLASTLSSFFARCLADSSRCGSGSGQCWCLAPEITCQVVYFTETQDDLAGS